jgi:hypothetical protein
MPVYTTRSFRRFQRQERISDALLHDAVQRAERGLIDADLGGGIIKQRVARPGQGRRGGYRTLIAYRSGHIAVFLFGFAKNRQADVDPKTLAGWQAIAIDLLAAGDEAIENAIAADELKEVP